MHDRTNSNARLRDDAGCSFPHPLGSADARLPALHCIDPTVLFSFLYFWNLTLMYCCVALRCDSTRCLFCVWIFSRLALRFAKIRSSGFEPRSRRISIITCTFTNCWGFVLGVCIEINRSIHCLDFYFYFLFWPFGLYILLLFYLFVYFYIYFLHRTNTLLFTLQSLLQRDTTSHKRLVGTGKEGLEWMDGWKKTGLGLDSGFVGKDKVKHLGA